MLSEEEKKLLKIFKAQVEEETEYFSVNAYTQLLYDSHKTVLNLITKLQKENEEKDKIIYEIARSNVKLKGYEIEEKYIDTTIRFFTKYVKNLERNPQWRNDKNE